MRWWLVIVLALGVNAQSEWRVMEHNGRPLRYQAVAGEAIIEGDIVLGPLDQLGKGSRAAAVITGQRFRWPDNSMPYVIDDDVPDRARVEGAIRHWNENTVMRLTPRQGEFNYVQFRRRNGFSCSSNVGMIGGRQFINLPDDCPLGSVIHEIGHAAGLFHTQSREDRDTFIRVFEDGISRDSLDQYFQQIAISDDIGAYPYDSIMHYSISGFALPSNVAMETIPAGIPLGQRAGLSASDIDAIARMQGAQPGRTVISSNPTGLEVLVDGRPVRTPAAFDWPAGSRHTLDIADSTANGAELRFGRWSDFGDRSHTITVTPANTVFTVHMRRLYRLPLTASPADGGQVLLRTATEDGLIPEGRRVELFAQPAPGFFFGNWSGFGFFSTHGSANPIRFAMTSPQLAYTASFTRGPVTVVTSSPPGLRMQVDGTAFTTPRQFTWVAGTRHDVLIDQTSQTTLSGGARHTWRAWSDGGDRLHSITASADGGTLTAEFDTQYQTLLSSSPSTAGRVFLDPAPADGFLPAGAAVTALASPNPGFAFSTWAGNQPGGPAQKPVTTDGVVDLQARFAQPATLTAAAITNGATFLTGPIAPGEILTLFGLDLGPDVLAGLTLTAQRRVATVAGGVRVLFDGTEAPVLYASSRQVAVVAPFNLAGKTTARVQLNYDGRLTNLLTVNVAPVAPGFFTFNSSGRGGGAFLNANGSVNTEDNPADRGSIVVLYATGLGVMRPAMNDGELAAPPYPQPAAPFTVRIAGRECEVLFGGAAPGLVAGLIQLNVRVPADIGPGTVPVMIETAGVSTPSTVSLAVR